MDPDRRLTAGEDPGDVSGRHIGVQREDRRGALVRGKRLERPDDIGHRLGHADRRSPDLVRQAVRWQLLSVSPASGVSPPRVERAELRIPTAAEMRALIDEAATTPYGLPVLLAATTGMRRGEVVELRRADVDLDACTISIRRGKTGTARRTIHLPASTISALCAHRKEQAERRLLCGPGWQD